MAGYTGSPEEFGNALYQLIQKKRWLCLTKDG